MLISLTVSWPAGSDQQEGDIFLPPHRPYDCAIDLLPQFTPSFWRTFFRLTGATVSLSSGFHPQSNGPTERLNQDLEATLRCLVSANPASLDYPASFGRICSQHLQMHPHRYVYIWVPVWLPAPPSPPCFLSRRMAAVSPRPVTLCRRNWRRALQASNLQEVTAQWYSALPTCSIFPARAEGLAVC